MNSYIDFYYSGSIGYVFFAKIQGFWYQYHCRIMFSPCEFITFMNEIDGILACDQRWKGILVEDGGWTHQMHSCKRSHCEGKLRFWWGQQGLGREVSVLVMNLKVLVALKEWSLKEFIREVKEHVVTSDMVGGVNDQWNNLNVLMSK